MALVALLGGTAAEGANPAGYQYLSPAPGSRQVSPWNNLVMRHGSALEIRAVSAMALSVRGSQSGEHPGRLALSDDSKTLVFVPAEPFSPGETVSVRFAGGPTAVPGEILPPLAFAFSVSRADWKRSTQAAVEASLEDPLEASPAPVAPSRLGSTRSAGLTIQPCDTMPLLYLEPTVLVSNNPDPGHLLITPQTSQFLTGWSLMVLDNLGKPLFYRVTPNRSLGLDLQPNGLLTYYQYPPAAAYYMMDSSYAVIDSFRTGNGYTTDAHELLLLPNGHALLMAYDPQPVDMSTVVTNGNPNAIVTGLIVQELDAAKNVVFQWRSWDHFQITDVIETPTRHLTDSRIDYVHGNAIEVDTDGNLLISSRHLNEITKIDRQTGDIIWRLGLNAKNNDFTFVNDTRGFSHQHDIRRLPNGHITLFDNGNFLVPEYSRGVEYQLDETNMIATQVWEYRNTPDVFGSATGSMRRRANGASLVNWGRTTVDPRLTDLHADGTKAFELGFADATSYRAIRTPWQTNLFVPAVSALDFGTVRVGHVADLPLPIHNNSASALELTCIVSTNPSFSVTDPVPVSVTAGGDATLNVHFAPTSGTPLSGSLYLRSVHGSELVAQVVNVSGIGDSVSGVGGGPADGPWVTVYPSPGHGTRTLAFAMAIAGRATLQIFDARGRLVATPFAGRAAAGLHEVAWNGRSNAGATVNSGLYFARFASPSGTRVIKLVNLLD
jgi:hypothetical protein